METKSNVARNYYEKAEPFLKRLKTEERFGKKLLVLLVLLFALNLKVIGHNPALGWVLAVLDAALFIACIALHRRTLKGVHPSLDVAVAIDDYISVLALDSGEIKELDRVLERHRRGEFSYSVGEYRVTFGKTLAVKTKVEDEELSYVEVSKPELADEVRIYRYENAPGNFAVCLVKDENAVFRLDFFSKENASAFKEDLITGFLKAYPELEAREING